MIVYLECVIMTNNCQNVECNNIGREVRVKMDYGLGRGKGRNNILVPNMHKLTKCN